jgi:hypothetical protein
MFVAKEYRGEFERRWNELGEIELRQDRRSRERDISVYHVRQQQEEHILSDPEEFQRHEKFSQKTSLWRRLRRKHW